jgi:hypothetical protein
MCIFLRPQSQLCNLNESLPQLHIGNFSRNVSPQLHNCKSVITIFFSGPKFLKEMLLRNCISAFSIFFSSPQLLKMQTDVELRASTVPKSELSIKETNLGLHMAGGDPYRQTNKDNPTQFELS